MYQTVDTVMNKTDQKFLLMEVIFKLQRDEGKTVKKQENNENMQDFQVLIRKKPSTREY